MCSTVELRSTYKVHVRIEYYYVTASKPVEFEGAVPSRKDKRDSHQICSGAAAVPRMTTIPCGSG